MSITETSTAQLWLDDAGNYVPADVYHGTCPPIGNSAKEQYIESPRLFEQEYVSRTYPREITKDLRIGIYTHMALWEPNTWYTRYSIPPATASDGRTWNRTYKLHKEEWAALVADCESNGLTLVDRDEAELVEDMIEAIRTNPTAAALVDSQGPTEQPLLWRHHSGLLCKNRNDKVIPKRGLIVDLKTTRKAIRPKVFAAEAENLGLHRNADFYLQGNHELTGETFTYIFLVVSKLTLEVACYDLDADWLQRGFEENEAAMHDMAHAYEKGDWRAPHEQQISTIKQPYWGQSQHQWEIE